MAEPVSEQIAARIATALGGMTSPPYRYPVAGVFRVVQYDQALLIEPDADDPVPAATLMLRSDAESAESDTTCGLTETAPFSLLYCLPARASTYQANEEPDILIPTLQNRICEDIQKACYNLTTPGDARVSRRMAKHKGLAPIEGWVVVEFDLTVEYNWEPVPV